MPHITRITGLLTWVASLGIEDVPQISMLVTSVIQNKYIAVISEKMNTVIITSKLLHASEDSFYYCIGNKY